MNYLLGTPAKMVHDPSRGHDPQVENHCTELPRKRKHVRLSFLRKLNFWIQKPLFW